MSKFDDDMARGTLPNGEALEALYGVGPWTPEPEAVPECVQCPRCGGRAYDLGEALDCENCGRYELDF